MNLSETDLMHLIQLSLGKMPNSKVFRNNTGVGWQGKRHSAYDQNGKKYTVLENARPLNSGLCVGSSDLIGWSEIQITPDLLGKKVAVFTAIEVKANGKPTPEQLNFLEAVKKSGGFSGVAKTIEDAKKIIGK